MSFVDCLQAVVALLKNSKYHTRLFLEIVVTDFCLTISHVLHLSSA